ncbi:MAG: pyridoxamine 5'-phosphate oxidase family protein [Acidimicrobiia bacterium]
MAGSVRMTDDEAWSVLAASHTGILTSLRRDGCPITLPVWFVVLDRHVYVSGPAATKKFSRIRRDPRVSFLVEHGTHWVELVGVLLSGRATLVPDGALADRVAAALREKYDAFRLPRTAMPDATRARYETPIATVEIVPDGRLLSWDNARLFATGRDT